MQTPEPSVNFESFIGSTNTIIANKYDNSISVWVLYIMMFMHSVHFHHNNVYQLEDFFFTIIDFSSGKISKIHLVKLFKY